MYDSAMSWIKFNVDHNRVIEYTNHTFFGRPCLHPDRIIGIHDLVYLVEGEWEIWEEAKAFILRPGDVLILAAGRHHFGRAMCRPGTRTIYVHACPAEGDAFVDDEAAIPAQQRNSTLLVPQLVSTALDPTVHSMFESIVRCHWSASVAKRAKARILVSDLLVELMSFASGGGVQQHLDRVIEYVDHHPSEIFPVSHLAEIAQMSLRTFAARFRDRTGESVHEYQIGMKIRRAASILRNEPDVLVKEVAHTLGFYDEFHFSRHFKRLMGVSPSHWRASGSARL